jgi:xanthine dehydrogenase YagS FAD-binding subunit
VHVTGQNGARTIPMADFHRLPGDSPEQDTNLQPNEMITAIELPPKQFTRNYTYIKIRDRMSYAFALVSVAAALELEGGTIKEARLALGGVAHKPWRDKSAEDALKGKNPDEANFFRAADVLLRDARPQKHNGFKVELARRAIARALTQAARGTPQVQSNKNIQ